MMSSARWRYSFGDLGGIAVVVVLATLEVDGVLRRAALSLPPPPPHAAHASTSTNATGRISAALPAAPPTRDRRRAGSAPPAPAGDGCRPSTSGWSSLPAR